MADEVVHGGVRGAVENAAGGGFQKADREGHWSTAKVQLELVDTTFTEGVARILMFGAQKYERDNWKKAAADPANNIERFAAAIQRHTHAILRGEYNDPETGMSHGYHIGCEAMFIAYCQRAFGTVIIPGMPG